ncbi:MAG: hypothetical protein ACR2P4_02725 [Gammaproteobacteria bacterium]
MNRTPFQGYNKARVADGRRFVIMPLTAKTIALPLTKTASGGFVIQCPHKNLPVIPAQAGIS